MKCFDLYVWVKTQGTDTSHFCLGFANMFFVEQKLAVKVTYVDCIQVDLKNISKHLKQ